MVDSDDLLTEIIKFPDTKPSAFKKALSEVYLEKVAESAKGFLHARITKQDIENEDKNHEVNGFANEISEDQFQEIIDRLPETQPEPEAPHEDADASKAKPKKLSPETLFENLYVSQLRRLGESEALGESLDKLQRVYSVPDGFFTDLIHTAINTKESLRLSDKRNTKEKVDGLLHIRNLTIDTAVAIRDEVFGNESSYTDNADIDPNLIAFRGLLMSDLQVPISRVQTHSLNAKRAKCDADQQLEKEPEEDPDNRSSPVNEALTPIWFRSLSLPKAIDNGEIAWAGDFVHWNISLANAINNLILDIKLEEPFSTKGEFALRRLVINLDTLFEHYFAEDMADKKFPTLRNAVVTAIAAALLPPVDNADGTDLRRQIADIRKVQRKKKKIPSA